MLDQSSFEIIRTVWNAPTRGSSLFQIVWGFKKVKIALKAWNKQVFVKVQDNIVDIKNNIQVLQDSTQTDGVISKEKLLQDNLDSLLRKEEYMWREKSKEKWMEDGDFNSKYFHLSTIIRRRFNHIDFFQNNAHVRVTNFTDIGLTFQDYYHNLFSSSSPSFPQDFEGLFPHSLSMQDTLEINEVPSNVEIHRVVFSMANGMIFGPKLSMLCNFSFSMDTSSSHLIILSLL